MSPPDPEFAKKIGIINEEEITIYSNTKIVRIEVDENKLKLILRDFKNLVEYRKSWIAVGAGMMAFLLSLVTADFREAFGIKAEIWNAIFLIAFITYAVWFIYCLIKNILHLNRNIVDETVRKIRGDKS